MHSEQIIAGERIMTLEFNVSGKVLKQAVFREDTAYTVTYRLLRELKVHPIPSKIAQVS